MELDLYFLVVRDSSEIQRSEVLERAVEQLRVLSTGIRKLECARKGVDVVYTLPDPVVSLPRARESPTREKTKWERFAETKGIKKRRRGFKVFDEDLQDYVHRYGSKSRKNLERGVGISEVKDRGTPQK